MNIERVSAVPAIMVAAMAMSAPAVAQTASQLTPPSFAPQVRQLPEGGVAVEAAPGLETPPGADALTVTLKEVTVEGGRAELEAQSRALAAPLAGHPIKVSDLFAAARAIQGLYARAGYVLARVTVPAQTLNDGTSARLVVLDGFIERIDIRAVPKAIRGRVEALLAPLNGKRGVTLGEIERALVLAGELPGTQLRSALEAGKEPGGTVLTIEAYHQSVTAQLTIDNGLGHSLGHVSAGLGVQLNSVAGLGEQIYLFANGYPGGGYLTGHPRNRALAGGILLPLTPDGLVLNLEAVNTRATPEAMVGALGTTSRFERYSARLRYAVARRRAYTLDAEIGFDLQEDRQDLISPIVAPFSLDRLRILRVKAGGTWFTPWNGTLRADATASFGLAGLGARTAADATFLQPLSREGADADFQRLEAQLTYRQPFGPHLGASIAFDGQTSFGNPLLVSEQLGLAQSSGLSTFDAGSIQGDSGYVARGEVISPWGFRLGPDSVSIAPYAFGAIGTAHLEMPTALERANVTGKSYGLGIRLGAATPASFRGASLTLEWGRRERNDGSPAGNRFTATAAIQL